MEQLRVCLFALLILGVGFAVSSDDCDKEIEHGSQCTKLGKPEAALSYLIEKKNAIKESIKDKLGWFKSNKEPKPARIGDLLNKYKMEFHAIAPGTKWCGDGDVAKDYDDLGFFASVDKCCRKHDKCESCITSGDTLLNLKNNGLFTRSHCECDQEFYDCLKGCGNKNLLASGIGHTYFNILKPQCYDCNCLIGGNNNTETYLETSCKQWGWYDCQSF